jgi:hypothetical protein
MKPDEEVVYDVCIKVLRDRHPAMPHSGAPRNAERQVVDLVAPLPTLLKRWAGTFRAFRPNRGTMTGAGGFSVGVHWISM